MPFDSRQQRRIMGKFATGITVVTTPVEGGATGMTANAVTSLSLDPPLVLVAVDRRGHMHGALEAAGCFAINILAADQEQLSRRFAASGHKDLVGLETTTAVTGAPILVNVLAYADCRIVQILDGGDHHIFIGEIQAGDARDGEPLLYFSGGYRQLGPA